MFLQLFKTKASWEKNENFKYNFSSAIYFAEKLLSTGKVIKIKTNC